MTSRRHDSGAALIIAIAIMTILLAIALTLFTVSRLELQTATNVGNGVRAEHLADAANAIAIAMLNRDFLRHPGVTSTDHAWRTYFNGAAFAGKFWAMRNGQSLNGGGAPLINISRIESFISASAGNTLRIFVQFPDRYREPIYRGPRTSDWLFIPRAEANRLVIYDPEATIVLLDDLGQVAVNNEYNSSNLQDLNSLISLAGVSFEYFPESLLGNPTEDYFPFVTSDFYGRPAYVSSNGSVVNPVFATATAEAGEDGLQYPAEQVDAWADVDNNGDGKKDSIWLPIPGDKFYPADGLDNNLNGLVDETQDNRLNDDSADEADAAAAFGFSPNADGSEDRDGDGVIDSAFDPDEAIEMGIFVYHGLGPFRDPENDDFTRIGDGFDNDGNGYVDDTAEDKLFLTAPLPGITIPVDFNADGIANDYVPTLDSGGNQYLELLTVTMSPSIHVFYQGATVTLGPVDVDVLDNDYDLFVNDYDAYAYVGPNTRPGPPFYVSGYQYDSAAASYVPITPAKNNSSLGTSGNTFYQQTWRFPGNWAGGDASLYAISRSTGYAEINLSTVLNGSLQFRPNIMMDPQSTPSSPNFVDTASVLGDLIRISLSGEPMCDLVGRAAVYIADEASKVNLNTAGGQTYDETLPDPPLMRALDEGQTQFEYDTRVLPDIGVRRAQKMWNLLTGAPDGDSSAVAAADAATQAAFKLDAEFPGLGRVDDNGNALLLAMDGLDNDGDGMIDEGMNPAYPALLGLFEGIDEPAELQRSSALRNRLAETDTDASSNPYDNNGNGIANELGELGDLQIQNLDQIKPVLNNSTLFNNLRNFITAYSTDRNVGYVEDAISEWRALNDLDFSLATPQQIAAHLMLNSDFTPITGRTVAWYKNTDIPVPLVGGDNDLDNNNDITTNNSNGQNEYRTNWFARGLREGDTHLSAPADGILYDRPDTSTLPAPTTMSNYNHDFPADPQLEAMQLAADVADARDIDHTRTLLASEKLDAVDDPDSTANDWPTELNIREQIPEEQLLPLEEIQEQASLTQSAGKYLEIIDSWFQTFVTGADNNGPEARHISYAASGNEAIRINELMVRPVRRVEAEADTVNVNSLNPIPYAGMPNFQLAVDSDSATLNGTNVIGDGEVIDVPADDVVQFIFAPTAGLPAGRYYLTINTTDPNGVPTVTRGSELQYAIKYVPITILANNTITTTQGIRDDLGVALQYLNDNFDAAVVPALYNEVLDHLFAKIPFEYISGRPGEPPGWVYIDGTPRYLEGANPLLDPGYINLYPPIASGDPLTSSFYYSDGNVVVYDSGGNALSEVNFGAPRTASPAAGGGILTHTVTIPQSGSGYALCVAVRIDPARLATTPAFINFFDFSQEPDHEYVELANVSDKAVDLSNWELEVGIPNPANASGLSDVPRDPFRSVWRIPKGTTISPNGLLLLTFESEYDAPMDSKFDKFREPVLDTGGDVIFNPTVFNTNGIGIAGVDVDPIQEAIITALTDLPMIAGVTTPPIADYSWDTSDSLYSISGPFYDPTGSVFKRGKDPNTDTTRLEFADYVDNNGDGVTGDYLTSTQWANNLPAGADLATDQVAIEGNLESTPGDAPQAVPNLAAKPWDRIVSLQNVQMWTENPLNPTSAPVSLYDDQFVPTYRGNTNPDDVNSIARVILRGGVLPNYPEYDGIDNDGDGGWLKWGYVDLDGNGTFDDLDGNGFDDQDRAPVAYIPGTLDKDMVDNDLDGLIDERGNGEDFYGVWPGAVLDAPIVEVEGDMPYDPFASEGVDEGNLYFGGHAYSAGSYESSPLTLPTLPVSFFTNRAYYPLQAEYEALGNTYLDRIYQPLDTGLGFRDSEVIAHTTYNLDPGTDEFTPGVWEQPANWTVNGGALVAAGVPGGALVIQPEAAQRAGYWLVPGQKYLVTFTISGYTRGAVRAILGNPNDLEGDNVGVHRYGNDFFSEVLTCGYPAEPHNPALPMQSVAFAFRAIEDWPDSTMGLLDCTITSLSVTPVSSGKAIYATATSAAEGDNLVARLGDADPILLDPNFPINADALYLGTPYDPPEWKAFVERRWYPGDNVIVSLYEGKAEAGHVADRVTYREYDVINRAIDDLQDSRAFYGVSLDPDYPTWWLPNQMGLDFYRSLERKDPLYNGDRFGTQNRWEATDGNYDDWAESLSPFTRGVRVEQFPFRIAGNAPTPRFDTGGNQINALNLRLYQHAMSGSPLRMNTAARISRNPDDLVRLWMNQNNPGGIYSDAQYDREDSQFGAYQSLTLANRETVSDKDWAAERSRVRDVPFSTAADLTELPHLTLRHYMLNTAESESDSAYRFLFDASHVNFGVFGASTQPLPAMQDTALRGAFLGQDEADSQAKGNPLTEALKSSTVNPLTFTVGQAQFIPIRPTPNPNYNASYNAELLQYPSGQDFEDLMSWQGSGVTARAPAAWAPVFLFKLPNDDSTTDFDGRPKGVNRFPFYPSYPDGYNLNYTNAGMLMPLAYIFSDSFLFNQMSGTGLGAGMGSIDLARRWPAEQRIVMYVSEWRSDLASANASTGDAQRPDAVFIWDAADGVENGEYYLYVGTFIPGLRKNLVENFIDQDTGTIIPEADGLLESASSTFDPYSFLNLDPTSTYYQYGDSSFNPVLGLDAITDRTRATGLAPKGADPSVSQAGLVYPTDWTPAFKYRPNPSGYILYGSKNQGAWQPYVVTIRDNFLALRVRNLGDQGEIAAITHIVLAPRKRVPGKININTAEASVVRHRRTGQTPKVDEIFTSLLGLPGVVDVMRTVRDVDGQIIGEPIAADDDIAAPAQIVTDDSAPWTPPAILANAPMPPRENYLQTDGVTYNDLLAGAYSSGARPEDEIAALRLSALMISGRPKHPDGRYYEGLGDLARDASAFSVLDYPSDQLHPLSNDADPERRYDEVAARLRRMANLITARSDVFEIIATVQAGYGLDNNNDGWFDYRGNDEFVTTAETKGRLVYERRTPSEHSDETVGGY